MGLASISLKDYFTKFRESFTSKTIILEEQSRKLKWTSSATLNGREVVFTFHLFHFGGDECANRLARLLFEMVEVINLNKPKQNQIEMSTKSTTKDVTKKKSGMDDEYRKKEEDDGHQEEEWELVGSDDAESKKIQNDVRLSPIKKKHQQVPQLKRKAGFSLINPHVKR